MKIKYTIDSGANHRSRREDEISLEDLGYTLEEWKAMTEEQQEAVMRPIVFETLDWGFRLSD